MNIIFVDGPTASGKDYLIDNIVQAYCEKNEDDVPSILSSTDFVLEALPDLKRKYTGYSNSIEVMQDILEKHIDFLYELAKQKDDGVELAIVNRSIVSALVYNVDTALETVEDVNDRIMLKMAVTETLKDFKRTMSNVLKDCNIILVKLSHPGDTLEDKVNTAISRIKNRKDGKPLESSWVKRLVESYEKDYSYAGLFDKVINTTSDDHDSIISELKQTQNDYADPPIERHEYVH